MPELPEIETVKLQLQKKLLDQTITAIEQLHKKSLYGDSRLVIGKSIIGVSRLGKMLVLDLQDKMKLAIHFKMSGQLILISGKGKAESGKGVSVPPLIKRGLGGVENRIVGGHPSEDWIGKLPSKHTRVIFHFQSGDTMYFNDQRVFGWVKILTQTELGELDFVKKLGPEIWDISAEAFFELIHKKKKAIKVALMDQEMISGVGNIYANDGLWEARIHPKRIAQSLASQEAKLLRLALIKVLQDGIKYGGATAADAKYINLHGLGGTYQEHFRVYDRTHQPCRRCATPIQKITLGGRGTYFCPQCQK